MASLQSRNGNYRLQFTGPDRKRASIPLGSNKRVAETVKIRVEALVAARLAGVAVDPDTARWVAGLDDALADKQRRSTSSRAASPINKPSKHSLTATLLGAKT
jgi:hypothetical protein